MEIPSLLFTHVLRCPLTGLALEFIDNHTLPALGLQPETFSTWSGALLRADARALYPVRLGIPVLLAEELHPVVGEAPRARAAG